MEEKKILCLRLGTQKTIKYVWRLSPTPFCDGAIKTYKLHKKNYKE